VNFEGYRANAEALVTGDDWRVGNHDDLVLAVALALSAERIPSRRLVAFG
jgi:hypothetical protein